MATGLAAGISVEAAVSHGMVGLARRPRDGARIAFAVAAAAAAAGAVAVVMMYAAGSAEAHAAIMKWLLFPSSTVWTVAAVWAFAFHTDVRPRRFLFALTAAFAVMLAADFALPLGLLHDQVGELRPMPMAGGHAVDITGESPHALHLAVVALTGAAVGFLLYAVACVYRRGERGKAAYLGVAAGLFSLTMLVDTLTDYGVVTSFYTTPLLFAGVVLAVSLALRREALRDEAELRRYRTELESLVEARVADLDTANEQLAREVGVRAAAEDALRRRVVELDALHHLTQALVAPADLPAALQAVARDVAQLFGASCVTIDVSGDDVGFCRASSCTDGVPSAPDADTGWRETRHYRSAVESREALVVEHPDPAQVPPEAAAQAASDPIRRLLLVPLVTRGGVVGVLTIACGEASRSFGLGEMKLARTVADALAAAVLSAQLHERETRLAAARERQHLARELHDAVTQTVYSATLIADALPEVWRRDPAEGMRGLETLRRLVHGALAEMRMLLFELRPGALRTAPLDTLLERLGAALAGQVQVPVDVEVREEVAVPPDVKVVLYRVAQEALSNVAKHAHASRVSVVLTADERGARLTVCDDGQGFDPQAVGPERMGLRIMRERLEQIGATVGVDSRPGQGTTVVADWPRVAVDTAVPAGEGPG